MNYKLQVAPLSESNYMIARPIVGYIDNEKKYKRNEWPRHWLPPACIIKDYHVKKESNDGQGKEESFDVVSKESNKLDDNKNDDKSDNKSDEEIFQINKKKKNNKRKVMIIDDDDDGDQKSVPKSDTALGVLSKSDTSMGVLPTIPSDLTKYIDMFQDDDMTSLLPKSDPALGGLLSSNDDFSLDIPY